MGILERFFQRDDSDLSERHGEAQRFLGWARSEECSRFLEKLDHEAGKNIDITDTQKMIASSVRANTLREVARWLRDDIRRAEVDLRSTEQELRNG